MVASAERVTTLALPAAVTFDRIVVQEDIRGGQHIAGFEVEADVAGTWRRIATGSTVGYKRILQVPLTTALGVRIIVRDTHGTPLISRVSLHATGA
jgi:alpha-L-fucosidase